MSAHTTNATTSLPSPRSTDPNSIDLSLYKGDIRVCPFCKPLDRLSGRACAWCMSRGYVSMCLNCDGTGLHTSKAVWDGKSDHSSTCNLCGGKGLFPASERDFIKGGGKTQEMLDAETESVGEVVALAESIATTPATVSIGEITQVSAAAKPMQNLQINRPKRSGNGGNSGKE